MAAGIERVTVIGAGTMGHGIAQVAAQAGCDTVLYDIEAEQLEEAMRRIGANLAKGVERGKVSAAERQAALQHIRTVTDLAEAVKTADLVLEAVPEKLELKRQVLSQVDEHAGSAAIFASNTSSLRITALAAGLRRPERFLGMHFFNPVPLMELLELVVHDGTSCATLAAARDVGERMGKTVIVVNDHPGFATSRLGVLLGLEAIRMVEEGVAEAADIDTAMELGYRHPMGPLKLTDLVGLDVRLGIAEYLHRELGSEAFRPPELLRRMVEDGNLGKKSGSGFYRW